jgi:hypothetical protein
MWVFDDGKVGLVQEPFIAGADTVIDRMVANIPNAEEGINLMFSVRRVGIAHAVLFNHQRVAPSKISVGIARVAPSEISVGIAHPTQFLGWVKHTITQP